MKSTLFLTTSALSAIVASAGNYFDDAGTDTTIVGSALKHQYCPEGYKVVLSTTATDRGSFQTTATSEHETCEKCPEGQSNAGGMAPSCHDSTPDQWVACSHVSCKPVTTQHKCFHTSENLPSVIGGLVGTACPPTPGGVTFSSEQTINTTRISVFHHGFEQEGTRTKCKLSGSRADASRTCDCMCQFPGAVATVAPTAVVPTASCPAGLAHFGAVAPPATQVPTAGTCTDVLTAATNAAATCTAGTGGCTFSETLHLHSDLYDSSEVCQGKAASPDYVVKYTNPTASPINFKWNSCDADTKFDVVFAIYDISDAGACTQVVCADDEVDPALGECKDGKGIGAAFIHHTIPANSDLYLILSSFSKMPGTFKLHITECE
jgi:hypothetical protein